MITKRESQDMGRYINDSGYAVDYGHRIEPITCADESELGESMVMAGLRRAETERSAAAEGFLLSSHRNTARRSRNFRKGGYR